MEVEITEYPYDLPREMHSIRSLLQAASSSKAVSDFKSHII